MRLRLDVGYFRLLATVLRLIGEHLRCLNIFYEIGDSEGELFIITGVDESRTWSYLYDPDDVSYGSLTVSISGSGGNTAKVFLSESQRNSIHQPCGHIH